MKQTITTLNASLEIAKNLWFIRQEKSAKKMHIMEVKVSSPAFKIVHHIKNLVNVPMSMISLLIFLNTKIIILPVLKQPIATQCKNTYAHNRSKEKYKVCHFQLLW